MGHVLCTRTELKHRKNLGERVDGQPEPEHLCGAAEACSQFVQLQVWEVEMAEGPLVQRLSVLACTSQPPHNRGVSKAEDPRGRRWVQPFSQRGEHYGDRARAGVFDRYNGVSRRALNVVRQA